MHLNRASSAANPSCHTHSLETVRVTRSQSGHQCPGQVKPIARPSSFLIQTSPPCPSLSQSKGRRILYLCHLIVIEMFRIARGGFFFFCGERTTTANAGQDRGRFILNSQRFARWRGYGSLFDAKVETLRLSLAAVI